MATLPTNYRTPNERWHDADRLVCLPRPCPTCSAAEGDPCKVNGTIMFRFHPSRRPVPGLDRPALTPKPVITRCWCGRPIHTVGPVFCAEHD